VTDLTKASEARERLRLATAGNDEYVDGLLDAYAEAVRSDTLADVAARLPEALVRRVQRTPAHRGWYIDHEPTQEGDWMHDEGEPCPAGICQFLTALAPTPDR
jgi:hypothetical protein